MIFCQPKIMLLYLLTNLAVVSLPVALCHCVIAV